MSHPHQRTESKLTYAAERTKTTTTDAARGYHTLGGGVSLYLSAAYLLLSFSGPSVILRHTNARTIIILMAILRLVSLADMLLPAQCKKGKRSTRTNE